MTQPPPGRPEAREHGRTGLPAEGPRGRRLYWLALLTLVLLAILGGVLWTQSRLDEGGRTGSDSASGAAAIGGPFQLVDQTGRAVDQRILTGKWTALFFGYTYCPDVCPTTLQTLAAASDRLGDKARDFQVVLITVDPQRDTPAQLKLYLSNQGFPKGAIGLTGAPEQVKAALSAFKVYSAKTGSGDDYLMDHTAAIYLIDPKGAFSQPLAESLGPDKIAEQIRAAMARGV